MVRFGRGPFSPAVNEVSDRPCSGREEARGRETNSDFEAVGPVGGCGLGVLRIRPLLDYLLDNMLDYHLGQFTRQNAFESA